MTYINNGNATTIWHGITHNELLRRCAQATEEEACAMSFAAAMMVAGECSEQDWLAAEQAFNAVEKRLVANYAGEVKLNRYGRPHGGVHPALV